LLCFDPDYAAAIGLPARGLELALNLMVAAAAVAGAMLLRQWRSAAPKSAIISG
jgi:ABC-type Mn2+/Zn2+ transport system permease subunit